VKKKLTKLLTIPLYDITMHKILLESI